MSSRLDYPCYHAAFAGGACLFRREAFHAAGGYAQPLTAGDPFVGIAYEEIDNTGGSDGDKSVRVYLHGGFCSMIGEDSTVRDTTRRDDTYVIGSERLTNGAPIARPLKI